MKSKGAHMREYTQKLIREEDWLQDRINEDEKELSDGVIEPKDEQALIEQIGRMRLYHTALLKRISFYCSKERNDELDMIEAEYPKEAHMSKILNFRQAIRIASLNHEEKITRAAWDKNHYIRFDTDDSFVDENNVPVHGLTDEDIRAKDWMQWRRPHDVHYAIDRLRSGFAVRRKGKHEYYSRRYNNQRNEYEIIHSYIDGMNRVTSQSVIMFLDWKDINADDWEVVTNG